MPAVRTWRACLREFFGQALDLAQVMFAHRLPPAGSQAQAEPPLAIGALREFQAAHPQAHPAIVLDHARPFDGVPIEGRVIHIHAAVGLVKRPIIARAHDDVAIPRQPGHVEQAIHHDGRARMLARRRIGEVARVEEIPLPVVIPEWERVYREAVGLAIHQLVAVVHVRPFRLAAGSNTQIKLLRFDTAHSVVEIVCALEEGGLGCPVFDAGIGRRGHQSASKRLPVNQVSGTQGCEDTAIGQARLAGRPKRIIDTLVADD